jgi:tetratricopeptide (TPR) repeat protein
VPAYRGVTLAVALVAAAPSALADTWENCTSLSFAPLDQNIPACTRLIEEEGLADRQLLEALVARAEAYEFAVTYRSNHDVGEAHLLETAAADLDRALLIAKANPSQYSVELPAALSQRAGLSFRLGRYESSSMEYAEALQLSGGQVVSALHGRALALKELGRLDEALSDISAILRIAKGTPNEANWAFARGELYQSAGRPDEAEADFRQALALQPDHIAARDALLKLNSK